MRQVDSSELSASQRSGQPAAGQHDDDDVGLRDVLGTLSRAADQHLTMHVRASRGLHVVRLSAGPVLASCLLEYSGGGECVLVIQDLLWWC